MNPDSPKHLREELESRLTALLLGELEADDAELLRKLIAQDAGLAALHKQLELAIGLVRETGSDPIEQSTPLRLSDERREKLLAHFKTVAPKEFAAKKPRGRFTLIELAAVLAICAILAALLLPTTGRMRSSSRSMAVVNNLRQIDGAKQQWALENKKSASDTPTFEDLKPYLSRGQRESILPVMGEDYVIGKVGEPPAAEMNPAQAKKFGNRRVTRGVDGLARVTLDYDTPMGLDLKEAETAAPAPQAMTPPPLSNFRVVDEFSNGKLATPPASGNYLVTAGDATSVNGVSDGASIFLPRGGQPDVSVAAATQPSEATAVSGNRVYSANDFFTAVPADDVSGLRHWYGKEPVAGGDFSERLKRIEQREASPGLTGDGRGLDLRSEFSGVAQQSGQQRGSDRYSFYRPMSQLGTESSAVNNKLTLNYADVPAATPGVSGELVTKGAVFNSGSVIRANEGPVTTPMTGQPGLGISPAQTMAQNRRGGFGGRGGDQPALANGSGRGGMEIFGSAPPTASKEQPAAQPDVSGTATGFGVQDQIRLGVPVLAIDSDGAARERLSETLSGKSADAGAAPRPTAASAGDGLFFFDRDADAKQVVPPNSESKGTKVAGIVANSANTDAFRLDSELEDKPTSIAVIPMKNADATEVLQVLQDTVGERNPSRRRTDALAAGLGGGSTNVYDVNIVGFVDIPRLEGTAPQTREFTRKGDGVDVRRQTRTPVGTNGVRFVTAAPKGSLSLTTTNNWNVYDYDAKEPFSQTRRAEIVLPESQVPSLAGGMPVIVLGDDAILDQIQTATANLDRPKVPVAAANTSANPPDQNRQYFAAKQKLDELVKARTELGMQIASEQTDLRLPKESAVEVIDHATAPKPSLLRDLFGGKAEVATRVRIEPPIRPVSGAYDPYFIQTESETIQSQPVLAKAIEKLDLGNTWSREAGRKLTTTETVERLKKDLEVRTAPDTGIAEIRVKNNNPAEAARIANSIADAYREFRVDAHKQITLAGITTLGRELAEKNREIAELQQEVDNLRKTEEADATPAKPATALPVPQPEVQTRDNAFSTFSLNVSDVSFKLAGASLEKGVMPDPASIRSEEFINAFDYRDPEASPGSPIAFASERARYPFAHNRELLRFSVKTAAEGRQAGRPLNLVLLLDNSGSMERADRVQIIREALRVLASQLQPQDKFSVVTFSRAPRLWADGRSGSQAAEIANGLSNLTPEGGTNLEEAMNLAYATALRHYLANGINRVVLLTDGAANLGNVDPASLKQKVEANRKQGIALDCFGIGWEGYNDDLLEVLARNGDGRYGFINSPEEAASEFAAQLAGALKVAASDVKVQVEFNPSRVTSYRQIGYAKHQLTKEQFRDNTVDAAEIAAQEAGNALYTVEVNPAGQGPVATVRVRYKVPGTANYREQEWAVPFSSNAVALEQASPAMRLAATASAFSEWLATSPFAAEVTPNRLLGYLNGVPAIYGADQRPQKLEWMIRQANSIAGK